MEWPSSVTVQEVRSKYLEVSLLFSPIASFHSADKGIDRGAALSIVSSRPEYWESVAQVVSYGSSHGDSAHELWQLLQGFAGEPSNEFFQSIITSQAVVPHWALSTTARFFRSSFADVMLDEMAVSVVRVAGSIDDCIAGCTKNGVLDPSCAQLCVLGLG